MGNRQYSDRDHLTSTYPGLCDVDDLGAFILKLVCRSQAQVFSRLPLHRRMNLFEERVAHENEVHVTGEDPPPLQMIQGGPLRRISRNQEEHLWAKPLLLEDAPRVYFPAYALNLANDTNGRACDK